MNHEMNDQKASRFGNVWCKTKEINPFPPVEVHRSFQLITFDQDKISDFAFQILMLFIFHQLIILVISIDSFVIPSLN